MSIFNKNSRHFESNLFSALQKFKSFLTLKIDFESPFSLLTKLIFFLIKFGPKFFLILIHCNSIIELTIPQSVLKAMHFSRVQFKIDMITEICRH